MKRILIALILGFALAPLSTLAAPVAFTPAQQEVINKLNGKGGLVMQLAADSDALVVNLSLGGKSITDAESALLKDLPKVSQLNLANTAITDAGLAVLSNLPDLTMLHLEKTAITDAGLKNVKTLAKLEYLNLYSTTVTDAGLANLSDLKNLKKLYLWQSKVTDAGVATLKKAVPAVIVNRGEELAVVAITPPADPKKPMDKKPADKTPTPTAAAFIINTKCPVSGKDVVPQFTAVYETKTVGLCCEKCLAAFTKEPAKFATKIVADVKPPAVKPVAPKPADVKPADVKPADKKVEAKPADVKPADTKPVTLANTKCPVSGKEASTSFTSVYEGKTVGLCCEKCLAAFAKDPAKFASKI